MYRRGGILKSPSRQGNTLPNVLRKAAMRGCSSATHFSHLLRSLVLAAFSLASAFLIAASFSDAIASSILLIDLYLILHGVVRHPQSILGLVDFEHIGHVVHE